MDQTLEPTQIAIAQITAMTAATTHIDISLLPPALRELVRVLGEADALRLVGRAGGGRITVPKRSRATPDHPLCVLMGEVAFGKLVEEYDGAVLELPNADAYVRELRHEQVRQLRAEGLSMDDIGRATGYCRRHVINILHGKTEADVYTMDLFEEAPKVQSYAGRANNPFGL